MAFSPDGRTLASGGRGGSSDDLVRLWDAETGEIRATLEGAASRSVAFSPDGRIFTGGSSPIRLWDGHTWELRSILEGQGDGSVVISVAFSPDGATLASGNSDGTILLWDMSPHLAAGPTSIGLSQPLPDRTALLPSYPNPFNQKTWIPFQLDAPARVRLTIHDVRGALVRQIDLGHRPAGRYRTTGRAARWDGRDERGEPLASGVYFARLHGGPVAPPRWGYCQMLWMRERHAPCDGGRGKRAHPGVHGVSGGLFELPFAIDEGVAVDEMGDELMAVEPTPVLLRLGGQLEDHGQRGDS